MRPMPKPRRLVEKRMSTFLWSWPKPKTDRRRIVDAADDEARASLQAEKEQVAAEVSELKEYREFLTDDIAILEQHLAESRTALQASVAALSDLVDAPENFRVPSAPSTSGVDVPEQLVAPQSDVSVVEQDADSDELVSDDDLIEFVDQSSGEALIFEPEPLPDSDDDESSGTAEASMVEAEIQPESEADDELTDYEPDVEDSVLLVDLTEAASVSDPASGQMTAIAPPTLVTAADLETSAGDWIDELSTDSGPATEPVPAVPESLLFEEPSETPQDPFLSQLRDAVQQGEPGEFSDDALTAFFDSDDEEDRRTWFNRRR